MKLRIGKTAGYNNKILISSAAMKIDDNKDINKAKVYRQKSRTPAVPSKAHADTKIHSKLR